MTPQETVDQAIHDAKACAFRQSQTADECEVAFSAIDRVAAHVAATLSAEAGARSG